ncbi:MAG: hypothetical protein ACRDBH_08230 [Bosea sp. (in: a-proteobacteria)]
MTLPPPNPAARILEIRADIAKHRERAGDLIADLLDLADGAPDRAAVLEAAALAIAAVLFAHLPPETLRVVRNWRKEGSNGGSPPNPTVRDLGCTVDAADVSDTWAALRVGYDVAEYAEEAWLEARVVPHVERDPLGVHKLRLRRKHRPQRPGYDWFAISDRIGDTFVIRKIEPADRLGKD